MRMASSHAIPIALSGFSKCQIRNTSSSPLDSPSEPPQAANTRGPAIAIATTACNLWNFIFLLLFYNFHRNGKETNFKSHYPNVSLNGSQTLEFGTVFINP